MKLGIPTTVVLVLALAFACAARGPAVHEPGAPALPDLHPGHDVIWSQTPVDGNGAWASQFAPDFPFYAESATDFVASESTEITHVHWWGTPSVTREEPTLRVTRASDVRSGRPDLDCSSAELRGCNVVIDDTNIGAPSNVDLYGGTWLETGPEVVYMLRIPFAGTAMTAALSNMTADLDIFLLPDCDETMFLHAEDHTLQWTFTSAGIYYLVVEGYDGAESNYTLTIECADVPPIYFAIRFYDDLPVGRDRSVPGTMLYEHHTIHDNEAACPWPHGSCYWADIPSFPVVQDERYWVSVQCVRNFTDRIQWYWAEAESVVDNDGVIDFEELGLERWTAMELVAASPRDFAVELADIQTPVEARSWGVIKSLYR